MKKLIIGLLSISTLLTACSDATFDRVLRWNNETHIECYQYDQKVLDDISTGKVEFAKNGSGFYYRSKKTDKLVQTIGLNCSIKEL